MKRLSAFALCIALALPASGEEGTASDPEDERTVFAELRALGFLSPDGPEPASAPPPSADDKEGDPEERETLGALSGAFGYLRSLVPDRIETDPVVAERMRRSRRSEVVVALDDPLFGPEMVRAGVWQSEQFMEGYGTGLFLTEPWQEDRIPVVLVHDINGSPAMFHDMAPRFRGTRYQPVTFFYPSGMALEQAGRELLARVSDWVARHGVSRLAVVGHSMGSLVSKAAADLSAREGAAVAAWRVLVAITPPFRGFRSAAAGSVLASAPPAWSDLREGSPFLEHLGAEPLPGRIAGYLFFAARGGDSRLAKGNDDNVIAVDSNFAASFSQNARDVYGFYEDHVSILDSERAFRRLVEVLDREIGRPLR